MLFASTSLLLPLFASCVLCAVGPLETRQSNYPPEDVPGPVPQAAWIATYNTAKAAGLIPGFAPSTMVNGMPIYTGVNAGSGGACSWTVAHCFDAYDVVDAPTGIVGISFDDGPQLASPPLYQFLASQNQASTHFMIGSRILDNPSIFQQAIATGGHIAVHTWSHPHMTTLTDMQVVGELGWTAQIIFDQSGKVPAFWRPPYGDVDNRVRAIAKEVFGLYTVIWNEDTNDWCLTATGGNACVGAGPGTDAGLDAELQGWFKGPKAPGLIILEHELTSRSVGGFIRNFPTLLSQGWIPKAIPDIWSVDWYLEGVGIGQGRGLAVTETANSSSSGTAFSTANSTGIPTQASRSAATSATVELVTPTSYGSTITAQAVPTTPSSSRVSESASASTSSSAKTSGATRLGSLGAMGGALLVLVAIVA